MALEVTGLLELWTARRECWSCGASGVDVVLMGESCGARVSVRSDFMGFDVLAAIAKVGGWLDWKSECGPECEEDCTCGYWCNRCRACGTYQGGWYVFGEPGGSFFPETAEECSRHQRFALWTLESGLWEVEHFGTPFDLIAQNVALRALSVSREEVQVQEALAAGPQP